MIVRQLTATYVLLVVLAIVGFTVPVALTLTDQIRTDTEIAVRREAETAARLLAGDDDASRGALSRLVDAYQRETSGRLDVQLDGGRAAAPLAVPVAPTDAAFAAALAGQPWYRWGDAPALGKPGLVLAVPARDGKGELVGAVRISYPSAPIDRRIRQIWMFRGVLAALVLVAAAALGLLLARRLTLPLRLLTVTAARLRDGDLGTRAPETGPAEVRALARTLNNATETIDVLVRSQRSFVADASHQLRTPLTALRLALDNVADGADDPASVREDVDRATAEVVRMTRMVNGLLALAKAEADVVALQPVRVAEVVAGRLDVWRLVADERGVTVSGTGDAGLSALTTPGHLEQVLDNLLSNALDFSPDGGTVVVSIRVDGDRVAISVIDQGPGLLPAERDRAFDRFWRGPRRPDRPGSGLGLSVVKQLVLDDGGTVRLADTPGGGLTVQIHLRAA